MLENTKQRIDTQIWPLSFTGSFSYTVASQELFHKLRSIFCRSISGSNSRNIKAVVAVASICGIAPSSAGLKLAGFGPLTRVLTQSDPVLREEMSFDGDPNFPYEFKEPVERPLDSANEAHELRREMLHEFVPSIYTPPDSPTFTLPGDDTPPVSPTFTPPGHSHDNSDLTSVLSLDVPPSLTSGSTLSKTPEIARTGSEQFAALLLEDHSLSPHFETVIHKAGAEKFKRNFFRLLQKYANNLKIEASNPVETKAARFVSSQANRIVHLLLEKLNSDESEDSAQLATWNEERELRLERFLRQQDLETPQIKIPTGDPMRFDEYEADEDSEDDEIDEPERPSLVNFNEVKRFMVGSTAYKQLVEAFISFANPTEIAAAVEQTTKIVEGAKSTPYRIYWSCVGRLLIYYIHYPAEIVDRAAAIKTSMILK